MFFDSLTEAIKSLVKEVRFAGSGTAELADKFEEQADRLKSLAREIRLLHKTLRLRMPGEVKLEILSQENGMSTVFRLRVPASAAADVLVGGSRKLVVKVGDRDAVEQTLAGDATVSEELTGEEHEVVSGSIADTDDDGLTGPAREFSFPIPDVTPPGQPGDVSIEIVSQD